MQNISSIIKFVRYDKEILKRTLDVLKPIRIRKALIVKDKSTFIREENHLKIYKPNDIKQIRKGNVEKYEIGQTRGTIFLKEKTIMVVGTTGAGKSTFLNSLLNYVLDVHHSDDFRFKLIDVDRGLKNPSANSVTKKVTLPSKRA